MIIEKIKELNPSVNEIKLKNYLDNLFQNNSNAKTHLETFFYQTEMIAISQIYKEADLRIIEFINSNGDDLAFVASKEDVMPYTILIYDIIEQGFLGDILPTKPLSFNEVKSRQQEKVFSKYEEAQKLHVINGICFTALLKGEWYNSILEKRKSAGRSRSDQLCYILIPAFYTNDDSKTVKYFEGILPLAFIEIIDAIWDEISLNNFRLKESYLLQIMSAQTVEGLNFDISFPPIQTLDLNQIADIFVKNPQIRLEDRKFIQSKKEDSQYHLLVEFDITKSMKHLYQITE